MARARWWQKTALCRYYALAIAVAIISLGLAVLVGVLNWGWQVSLFYIPVGLLFAYAGLFVRDKEGVRQMVEGLGVLLVLVTVMKLVALLLSGQSPYWGLIETSTLAVGATSILKAKLLRDGQGGEGLYRSRALMSQRLDSFHPPGETGEAS